MKVIVYAHRLEVGGTQTNAIDLAAAVRDMYGWDVLLFAQPGPMLQLVYEKGLRFVPAPDARIHPSLTRMKALRSLVKTEKPDLIHTWDWWQCLDAFYSVHLPMRIPMVASDMMMELTRILPKRIPTTFGVPELVDRARLSGRRSVEVILPPVDVAKNAPGVVNGMAFRDQYGLAEKDIAVVTVSRLSDWMKRDSLEETIRAVGILGRELPISFLVVGEGLARQRLERLSDKVNDQLGRCAIVFTGALLDPRPAYAAADIVVGMGGSALRAMAFGKPVVVVGERGFAELFSRKSADKFLYSGVYGREVLAPNKKKLDEQLRELAFSEHLRLEVGTFSREFIIQNYSLRAVSARLAKFYEAALADEVCIQPILADGFRTAAVYLRERRFLTPSRDRVPRDANAELPFYP